MLKIKDSVDLKQLEKFGFTRYTVEQARWDGNGLYSEIGYKWDDGTNTITVLTARFNSDWKHPIKTMKLLDIDESGWERGVSLKAYDVVFDLIMAGLVEKVNIKLDRFGRPDEDSELKSDIRVGDRVRIYTRNNTCTGVVTDIDPDEPFYKYTVKFDHCNDDEEFYVTEKAIKKIL